ncbi:MAG: hypothetical protein CMG04_09850 [Candidatus Marinimicrobia bacterium]|nr:hypothetical protein [Candidatus Neomarinimicrobiota bacterium]
MKNIFNSNFFISVLNIYNQGKGFVTNQDTNETFYIGRNRLKGALDRDLVKVSLINNGGLYKNVEIVEIFKRGNQFFTAKIYSKGKQILASLYPYQSKKIILKNIMQDVSEGDIVAIKITDWRENHKSAYAEILKIKSRNNDLLNDYYFVSGKYGLSSFEKYSLNPCYMEDLKEILKNNLKNRADLSEIETFTIDPEKAQDFDDAISIIENNKTIELYVHIADVSTFVKESSNIDRLAKIRANSYYFDDKTVHMLPEILSTNICSLIPNRKRLALTLKIIFDSDFNILSYDFFESSIKSDRMFSYEEVQKILDEGGKSSFLNSFLVLRNLTNIIRTRRLVENGLDINYQENTFILGKDGIPKDLNKNQLLVSHIMIEECMMLANRLAAKKLLDLNIDGDKGIYRNHERPNRKNEEFLIELLNFTDKGEKYISEKFSANTLNKFFDKIKLKSNYNALSKVVIRKMQKATYSSGNMGHFGLGFLEYTHFTSPIRRYSDIVVHRIIKKILKNENSIYEIIDHCNKGEIIAQHAEREYKTLKSLKWLEKTKGDILKVNIIEVSNSKLTVNETLTGINGYLKKKMLPPDRYLISGNKMVLSGTDNNQKFSVGQCINVSVNKIDMILQEVYFKLT